MSCIRKLCIYRAVPCRGVYKLQIVWNACCSPTAVVRCPPSRSVLMESEMSSCPTARKRLSLHLAPAFAEGYPEAIQVLKYPELAFSTDTLIFYHCFAIVSNRIVQCLRRARRESLPGHGLINSLRGGEQPGSI